MNDRNLANELERHILNANFTTNEKIWLITDLVNFRRHLTGQSSRYLSSIELMLYRIAYGSTSRILQSTLYLIIIFGASYFSTESKSIRIQEISRFKGSIGLKFPGSLKSAIRSIKSCRNWLPKRSTNIRTRANIGRLAFVQRTFKQAGFEISWLFLLGSYIRFLIIRNLVEGVVPKIEGLYTIGTVEPFQKYLSSYLLHRDKPVELFVHGIVLDPIASYQCYSSISSETQNQGLRGVDLYLFSLFRGGETSALKIYEPIERNHTKLESSDFDGVRSVLIFSSSVESGMPVLEVDSLFNLFESIEGYLNSEMNVVIRLHPGENRRLIFRVLKRHYPIKFQMDDDTIHDFDLAIGLPSTYIRIAKLRAKRAVILSDVIYNSNYFVEN